jgi:uncharacterized membrane protein
MAIYLIPVALLLAVILSFFGLARDRYTQFGVFQSLLRIIVASPLLASAVMLHFLRTNECTAMIPPGIPLPHFLVLLTGVLEILSAIGLLLEKTRRAAALCIAILMVVVFPANIFVAGRTFGGLSMPSVPVRLLIQIVYIWMTLLAGYGWPRLRADALK